MTGVQLLAIARRCPAAQADAYAAQLTAGMVRFAIGTVTRGAGYLGNLLLESGEFRFWDEMFTYTAEQLVQYWPRLFTLELARTYAGKPERIANRIYANRYGNGDEASGDGWRYHGRGPPQLTFHDNYAAAGAELGLDLVAHPELVATPEVGFLVAAWFWAKGAGMRLSPAALAHGLKPGCNLNDVADALDFEGLTMAWQGGLGHHAERMAYKDRCLEVLFDKHALARLGVTAQLVG